MASVLVVCDEDLAESFLQVGPKSSQQTSEEGKSILSHNSCVHRKRLTPLGMSYNGVPGMARGLLFKAHVILRFHHCRLRTCTEGHHPSCAVSAACPKPSTASSTEGSVTQ